MKTNHLRTTALHLAVLMAANLLAQVCVAAQIHGMVCLKNQGAIGMEGVIVTLTGSNQMQQVTNTGKNGMYWFTVPASGTYKLTYERVGKCLVVTPQETTLTNEGGLIKLPTVCAYDGSSISAADAVDSIILRVTGTQHAEYVMHEAVQMDLEVLKKHPVVSSMDFSRVWADFSDKPIRKRIEEAKFPEITADDLRERIQQNKPTLILDANGTTFFKLCHIPGAIDYEATRENLHQYLQTNLRDGSQAVTYCGPLGLKAKGCAENLIQLGFTNVVRLRGGLPGWVDYGGEVLRRTE